MKMSIKKTLALLLIAVAMPFAAIGQNNNKLQQRLEIVEIETSEDEMPLQVFSITVDGHNAYFLTIGNMGIGDNMIQVNVDPFSELFIPLGTTLDEVQASLEHMRALFDRPKGDTIEVQGCIDIVNPGSSTETVTVRHYKPLLTHMLEFSVERNGFIRAGYVSKSNFKALIRGVKFYRKLHPKQI